MRWKAGSRDGDSPTPAALLRGLPLPASLISGQSKRQGVHLIEVDGRRIVNPLQPGHLTPYSDATRPFVASIRYRTADGSEQMPNYLHGKVELDAEA
jgi:hypothetical protein